MSKLRALAVWIIFRLRKRRTFIVFAAKFCFHLVCYYSLCLNYGMSTIKNCRHGKEKLLVPWIINMGRMGFPVTIEQLPDNVLLFVKYLKRSNGCTDGISGYHWYEVFTKMNWWSPNLIFLICIRHLLSMAFILKNSVSSNIILRWT